MRDLILIYAGMYQGTLFVTLQKISFHSSVLQSVPPDR